MTTSLLGWYLLGVVLIAVGAVLTLRASGRVDSNLADVNEPEPANLSPLYDQTAVELGTRPDVPFSAGDETDVLQALRIRDVPPFVDGYRRWPVNVVQLPQRGAR